MQKHSISAFIEKTWTMLENGDFESVICWNEEGDSFRIIDQVQFEKEVLPIYFKHSNLTSFQRQLNMYNFHKRKTQKGHTEYYHRLFRRHQRELLRAIRRKPSEDEIQIGEELLRKLRQEHEETQNQNVVLDQNQNSIEINKTDKDPEPAQQVTEKVQTFQNMIFPFQDLYSHPMMWCYMPQPYQMPWSVGYAPEKIINTHVLIHSPDAYTYAP